MPNWTIMMLDWKMVTLITNPLIENQTAKPDVSIDIPFSNAYGFQIDLPLIFGIHSRSIFNKAEGDVTETGLHVI